MIVLNGREFHRVIGGCRWMMKSEYENGIDITFDATEATAWDWRMLAAALDRIAELECD